MRNTFSSPFGLPLISDLKKQQEAKISYLINNLKIDDVRSDENFKASTEKIIKAIQIAPIVFDEPKFSDHEYEQRALSIAHQMHGMSRDNYIHKVSMSYTGNSVLLNYKPASISWSSSEHGLLNSNGNRFIIYVELPELNPQKAVAEAKNLMTMTFRFANDNSAEIVRWNDSVAAIIDQKMNSKRDELKLIFGD